MFYLIDTINTEDDVMWNQAVQIIEKTFVILHTVSSTLKKFSHSVSFVFIVFLFIIYIFLLFTLYLTVYVTGTSKLLHNCCLDSY